MSGMWSGEGVVGAGSGSGGGTLGGSTCAFPVKRGGIGWRDGWWRRMAVVGRNIVGLQRRVWNEALGAGV